ncbi:MAG TPA: hypothetical protein VMA36_09970 [Candidatus Limnocylindria bacterium]|nr:hypothetical protein [Candidatus Limnocylindria bacterium]
MALGIRTRRALGLLACAAAVSAPLCGSAQPFSDEHVQGVVADFDGQEHLTLRDDRGFIDDVSLGDQTRITPEGSRIVPGMRLALTGYNAGKWFDATAIDVVSGGPPPPSDTPSYAQSEPPANPPPTNAAPSYVYPYPQAYSDPYAYAYPVPVYAYPVPVYAYPAPAYAYPAPAYPYYGPRYRTYYRPYYGARTYYGARVNVGVRYNGGARAWASARGWRR